MDEIFEQAMQLSERDRARLAEILIASLGVEDKEAVHSLWAGEIYRRVREIESSQVSLIPWSEARRIIMNT